MELANAPIRKIEPLIVDRLRLAFPESKFGIERIPQVMTIKEFEIHAKRSPFIGLAWVGLRGDTASGRQLKGDMLWRLVMIVRASNTLETRFKGDRKDIGLDAMVDVATALLHCWTLENVGAATVTLANSVIADGWSDDQIAIAQVDFQVSFVTGPAGFELMTIDDFKSIGATWITGEGQPDTIIDETTVEEQD